MEHFLWKKIALLHIGNCAFIILHSKLGMSKFVQFLMTNVLIVLWKFVKEYLQKLQRKLRYETDKKKIDQAAIDIKKKELKYKANKKMEDILKGKK